MAKAWQERLRGQATELVCFFANLLVCLLASCVYIIVYGVCMRDVKAHKKTSVREIKLEWQLVT